MQRHLTAHTSTSQRFSVWRVHDLGNQIKVGKDALKEGEAAADLNLQAKELCAGEEEATLQCGERHNVANRWRIGGASDRERASSKVDKCRDAAKDNLHNDTNPSTRECLAQLQRGKLRRPFGKSFRTRL
jgi:hypothetical protein